MDFLKEFLKSLIGLFFRLNPFFRLSLRKKLTIFVFHEVSDNQSKFLSHNNIAHTIDSFTKHINWIKKNFNVISPEYLTQNKTLPYYAAVISFDDGYLGAFDNGFKILEEKKIPAIVFINSKPLLKRKPSVAAIANYLETDEDFLRFAEEESFESPFHLSVSPKLLGKFMKSHNSEEIENAAYLFQGEVASYQTLKKWENNDLFFYGNHLYDHWNANALSSDEFKTEYKKNDEFLSQFKNYLNLFAFTNGKPETCFTQKHIDLLKSLTTKRVFSSSNGINKDLSNFLFGRLSTFDSDSTVNKLWFRLGITNSKFKT
jgi:peptidoglycan/xylan/chitin deacetylase (PgdA/CDA1 family)